MAVDVLVLKETANGERRVSATPETVKKLRAAGADVQVQAGAGMAAGFTDAAYVDVGARIDEGTIEFRSYLFSYFEIFDARICKCFVQSFQWHTHAGDRSDDCAYVKTIAYGVFFTKGGIDLAEHSNYVLTFIVVDGV